MPHCPETACPCSCPPLAGVTDRSAAETGEEITHRLQRVLESWTPELIDTEARTGIWPWKEPAWPAN